MCAVQVLVIALGIGAAVPGVASASGKADLVVSATAKPPSSVVAGGRLTAGDATRNRGGATAKGSATAYYLSRDGKKGAGDIHLGNRTVKALKRGAKSTGSATVSLPVTVPAGRYRLLACADDKRKVREANERNNCLAGGAFDVLPVSPPVSGPPVTSAGTPAPTTGGDTPTDGGDNPTGGGPPTGGGDPPGDGGPDTSPVNVHPHLATANAASATLGRSGGTITATGPDGSTFSLYIPDGALTGPEKIAMTPVDRIDGMGFSGGLGAAVQLEPEGLRLMNPASLTIDAAHDLTPAELTPFGYRGDGEDFHMQPLVRDPSSVTLSIAHFSGYGTAGATDDERNRQLEHQPTSPEDAQDQELADALRKEHECQLAGSSCVPEDELRAKLRAWLTAEYPGAVAALNAAANDDDQLGTAIGRAFTWIRNTQQLGFEREFGRDADALYEKIWATVTTSYNNAYQRCQQLDTSAINQMLTLLSMAQQFGASGRLDGSKASRCMSFELDFQSELTLTNPNNPGFKQQASASITNMPIKPYFLTPGGCLGDGPCGNASGPISNWAFELPGENADTYSLIVGGLTAYGSVEKPAAPNLREGGFGQPTLRAGLRMNLRNESVEVTDKDGHTSTRDMNVFINLLTLAHADEGALTDGSYGFFSADLSSGSKNYNRTIQFDDGRQLVEHTSFTLRHAPE